MRKVIGVLFIIAMILVAAVGCSSTTNARLAAMRAADAEARLASANAQGTVNVLIAQTDAHIEKMRAEVDLTKEMRQFDADLARQEYATALLEIQALQIALRETTEIIEPLGLDAKAAASNSWWLLILYPVLNGLSLVAILGVGYLGYRDLRERVDGQDAATEG